MNFAEQLKEQLNIVEVVGQYVRLKRQGAGQRWVGLCPFHSEKTPSFGVHSGHQYFKCFGCDAAGDVLKFVQQIESLTFPETLRLLAERYGIAMPERQRMDDPEGQRTAALLEIHEAAAEIFQENLRGPSGTEARAYLASRGVSADAAREFRLGLSDSSWQQLTQRLKRFGEALLVDSGLVMKRDEGPRSIRPFPQPSDVPDSRCIGQSDCFRGAGAASRRESQVSQFARNKALHEIFRALQHAPGKDRRSKKRAHHSWWKDTWMRSAFIPRVFRKLPQSVEPPSDQPRSGRSSRKFHTTQAKATSF